jgi:stage II sporulation protein AA (anti-sigma F factor antagonist)
MHTMVEQSIETGLGTNELPSLVFFDVEPEGDSLIVTLLRDLRELDYRSILAEGQKISNFFARLPTVNVVLDFQGTDYFGPTALGFFVKLSNSIKERGGNMVLCNVSPHQKEILQVTQLSHLWPCFESRGEALQEAAL